MHGRGPARASACRRLFVLVDFATPPATGVPHQKHIEIPFAASCSSSTSSSAGARRHLRQLEVAAVALLRRLLPVLLQRA